MCDKEKLIFWCSRNVMGIKGLGEKAIHKLVGVRNIPDLYNLDYNDLMFLGEKRAVKILAGIKQSLSAPLYKIIMGLCLPGVDKSISQIITADQLFGGDEEVFKAIPGIGAKTAYILAHALDNVENRRIFSLFGLTNEV